MTSIVPLLSSYGFLDILLLVLRARQRSQEGNNVINLRSVQGKRLHIFMEPRVGFFSEKSDHGRPEPLSRCESRKSKLKAYPKFVARAR